jgi:hypothetical protein
MTVTMSTIVRRLSNMESVLKEEFGIEVTIEDEKGIENG